MFKNFLGESWKLLLPRMSKDSISLMPLILLRSGETEWQMLYPANHMQI